jgi:hypothetical protein
MNNFSHSKAKFSIIPLSSREIQFVATGQSEAGIEFYSWDFNYSPPLEGAGGGSSPLL